MHGIYLSALCVCVCVCVIHLSLCFVTHSDESCHGYGEQSGMMIANSIVLCVSINKQRVRQWDRYMSGMCNVTGK